MRRTAIIVLALILFSVNLLIAGESETYTKDIPYSGEKSLKADLEFGMAQLKVSKTEGDFLARINGVYDPDNFTVEVKYDNKAGEGVLHINVKQKHSTFNFTKIDRDKNKIDNEWEIELGNKCPVDFAIDAGMASVDLDFTGLEVEGMNIDAGMASGTIVFNKPNKGHIDKMVIDAGKSSLECMGLGNANFDRLIVDAGMASVRLDFSGRLDFDGKVEIDAGMSSSDIVLNPGLGTRISYSEGWTSSISVPRGFERVKDDVYQSPGYDTKKGHLDFDMDVTMGSVDFKLAQSL